MEKEIISTSDEEVNPKSGKIPRLLLVSPVEKLFDRPELVNLACSYRRKLEYQIWFNCDTCFPHPNNGVCLGCAKQCLTQKHNIDPKSFQYSPFYCDKGHYKAGQPSIEGEEKDEEDYINEEMISMITLGQACNII